MQPWAINLDRLLAAKCAAPYHPIQNVLIESKWCVKCTSSHRSVREASRSHPRQRERERERHKYLVLTVHYMISDVALPDPMLVLAQGELKLSSMIWQLFLIVGIVSRGCNSVVAWHHQLRYIFHFCPEPWSRSLT